MLVNKNNYHADSDEALKNGRRCWECHKYTPHGKVRSLTSTPYTLGVNVKMK